MEDLNQCNFIGRLGKDVEIRHTSGGIAVANFSIACSDDYKDKGGNEVKQTNWINIVAFRRLAEVCGEYLSKGSQVYVSGKQVTRKWQDAESGKDRYSTEIQISKMQMLGGKGGADNQNQSAPKQQAPNKPGQSQQQGPNGAAPQNFDDFDDDIPF